MQRKRSETVTTDPVLEQSAVLDLPVHTVPTLVDVLPTLTSGEVEELASSFNKDLIDGLKEQKVILNLLELLKSRPQSADVDKYKQLEERAFAKSQKRQL